MSVIMAQGSDRWASKILTLPIFSDAFAKAVLSSPVGNVTMVLAMEVGSAQDFVLKLSEWAPSFDESFRHDLMLSPFMLEQYCTLCWAGEKQYMESTAVQLGFGCCEAAVPAISASVARAQRLGAIRSLTDKPPRKVLKPEHAHATNTPLLDQENAARLKWAARLEEIGKKAGAFSKLLIETSNETGLSPAEIARLRQLVLSSGAPRTMAVHIGNWERFFRLDG